MTDCREICDAASHCMPCASYDAELDRVSRGRTAPYVEGSDDTGRWAVLNGRFVRHPDED